MDAQTVQEVVRVLKAKGERISVRSIHGLTGGSFRDISRLLREVREFLDEDEAAALEDDIPEPVTPRGLIPQARAAIQGANARLEAERLRLGERRQRLRDLQAAGPVPVTRGDEVDDYLEAKNAHAVEVFHAGDAVKYQEGLVAQCEAERNALQADVDRLTNQVRTLRDSVIPEARQHLDELQKELATLRAKLPGVERLTADQERRVAAYEAELRGLLGE